MFVVIVEYELVYNLSSLYGKISFYTIYDVYMIQVVGWIMLTSLRKEIMKSNNEIMPVQIAMEHMSTLSCPTLREQLAV